MLFPWRAVRRQDRRRKQQPRFRHRPRARSNAPPPPPGHVDIACISAALAARRHRRRRRACPRCASVPGSTSKVGGCQRRAIPPGRPWCVCLGAVTRVPPLPPPRGYVSPSAGLPVLSRPHTVAPLPRLRSEVPPFPPAGRARVVAGPPPYAGSVFAALRRARAAIAARAPLQTSRKLLDSVKGHSCAVTPSC